MTTNFTSSSAKCKDYLRQTPQQAASRSDLKKLLKNREANGIFFTTTQKFEESDEPLSERSDIILIADEAHRSQYAIDEKVDTKTGKIKIGFARLVWNNLPNATFIGYIGTPISLKDRNTQDVFGNYIGHLRHDVIGYPRQGSSMNIICAALYSNQWNYCWMPTKF